MITKGKTISFISKGIGPILLLVYFIFVLKDTYSIEDLFGYYQNDYFQLVSDSLRSFGLKISNEVTCLLDLTDRSNGYYISWGILPSLAYALFDSVSMTLFNVIAPKVLLYLLMLYIHVLLIYLSLIALEISYFRAFVFACLYISSFPFFFFVHGIVNTEHIATLYSSTFVLASLLMMIEKKGVNNSGRSVGFFLGLSMLTRIEAWFITLFLVAWATIKKIRIDYRLIAFPLAAAFLAFLYNYLRFDDVLNFGETASKYQGNFIDEVYNLGLVPGFAKRWVIHFQEFLNYFFYLNPKLEIISDKLIISMIDNIELEPLEFLNPNLLGMLSFGIFLPLFKPNQEGHVQCLRIYIIALIPLFGFYVYFVNIVFIRYLIHFWPIIFITSVYIAHYFIREKVDVYSAGIGSLLPLLMFYFLTLGSKDIVEVRKSSEDFSPIIYPKPYNGMGCIKEEVPSTIKCGSTVPMVDLSNLENKYQEWNLLQLGVYKTTLDKCEALPFFGATLLSKSGMRCVVKLVASEMRRPICDDVRVYLQGKKFDKMNSVPSLGEFGCSIEFLAESDRTFIRFYKEMFKSSQYREAAPSIEKLATIDFESLAVECN